MPKSLEEINVAIESLRREVLVLALTREESDALLKLIEGKVEFNAIVTRLKTHIAQANAFLGPSGAPPPPPSDVPTS